MLIAAQVLQERNDLDGAKEQLEWLIANSSDPAFVPLAKLRLAGVLLEQKQYDQALAQVADAPPAFAGLYADRQGDILLAQGKAAEARKAWETALEALGANPATQIVQLKIDALGGA